ncbi:MAG: VTT domain-containing protein [Anaerolineaceae bacterium]
MKKPNQYLLIRIVTLIVVIAVCLYILSIRDQAKELAKYGYPGIFLLSMLSNGTIFVPAPGLLVVFTMGAVFNPFLLALCAGAGGALGELTGYLAGFSGQAVIEKINTYNKIINWMQLHKRWSAFLVFVLALIPNPMFDLAGIAAGALKIPLITFLIACWLGVTLKMIFFAFAGAGSFHLLF